MYITFPNKIISLQIATASQDFASRKIAFRKISVVQDLCHSRYLFREILVKWVGRSTTPKILSRVRIVLHLCISALVVSYILYLYRLYHFGFAPSAPRYARCMAQMCSSSNDLVESILVLIQMLKFYLVLQA